MGSDDQPTDSAAEAGDTDDAGGRGGLGRSVEGAVEGFDKRLIDLLAWLLDTETRARIYIYLRQHPSSTSDEIATGTGLYPSTVREAIVELHDEGVVTREKRAAEGAGNNPYAYEAISPSELVSQLAEQVQDELNAVLRLDEHLTGDGETDAPDAVTIQIDAPEDDN